MDLAGFTIRSFGVGMMTLAFVTWSCWAKCPDSSLPLLLDNAKGNWYVIASTPKPSRNPLRCTRLEITQTSYYTLSMDVTTLNPRNNELVRYCMHGRNDGMIKSTWRKEGTNRILGPFIHRISSSTPKYDSEMIMVVCDENRRDIPVGEFGMILSRESRMDSYKLGFFKHELSKYVDQEIIDVDHTNCGTI